MYVQHVPWLLWTDFILGYVLTSGLFFARFGWTFFPLVGRYLSFHESSATMIHCALLKLCFRARKHNGENRKQDCWICWNFWDCRLMAPMLNSPQIGHLHDRVFLLLRSEYFLFFLSCLNLEVPASSNLQKKAKLRKDSGHSSYYGLLSRLCFFLESGP